MIPITKPLLGEPEAQAARRAILSGWTTQGPEVAAFEREFTYPLGNSTRFRISHGEDYLPFFQAMGEAEVLLLEKAGLVQGVLSRVARSLRSNVKRTSGGRTAMRTSVAISGGRTNWL